METLSKILDTLGAGNTIVIIVLLFSIFIEITPIKINPIKSILNWIGKQLNSSMELKLKEFKEEVNQKFTELKDEQMAQRETLNKIVIDQENKEISRLRWEIIDFDNSIMNRMKHSRSQYRHILDEAAKYERMVQQCHSEREIELSSRVKESIAHIKDYYEERRDDHTLLYF